MRNKLKEVLDKQISLINISGKESIKIERETIKFVNLVKRALKGKEIFAGGSLAKKTMIKKKYYDIDIFIRFDKNYSEEKIKEIINNLKVNYGRKIKVHGSRDYLQFKKGNIIFELIPVLKIKNPKQARNITDLSYFHVNYVLNKIKKNKKLSNEIKLAKSFCFANNCYGAESFIRGFSGYGLELLIIYYGSFEKFLGNMIKVKENEKMIVDIEKHFKNKQEIMNELNEAKLESPIIFVDPTFKQRNALAALSEETFLVFQKKAGEFLKKPSLKFFEIRKIERRNFNLVLRARTDRQEGDIAGTKLLKFFRFLSSELEKKFIIEKKEFEYDNKKKALYYLKIKSKKEIIINGPPVKMKIAAAEFKSRHKKVYIKAGRLYAKEKVKSVKEFLRVFKDKNKKVMSEMGVVGLN